MLPIITAAQTRLLDAYTISNEPIKSINLMERAAIACTNWFKTKFDRNYRVYMFAGTGNNGGDAVAMCRLLLNAGYRVNLYVLKGNYSPDNLINQNRLLKWTYLNLHYLETENDFPDIPDDSVVVDGLLGSGLSKSLTGILAKLVMHMNQSNAIKVSIDIPSGLADKDNTTLESDIRNEMEKCIMADYTVAIETPFLSMLMPENYKYVGEWTAVSIGLNKAFLHSLDTDYYLIEAADISGKLKKRKKFDHKGKFGHLLMVAGKVGSLGAALLASRAALKSGVGLLTAHVPSAGMIVFQTALPEAMLQLDASEQFISKVDSDERFSAVALGPGLGLNDSTKSALLSFLTHNKLPLVIDADGLNLLSQVDNFLEILPENTILTPHPKEFDRLFGLHDSTMQRWQKQKEISLKYKWIIVLKGAHTSVSNSTGKIYFNTTGNAAMAKGGSGDVLTGIIGALLAKSYSAFDSACLAVYLHGLAGDMAKNAHSSESVLASEIIEYLSEAFRTF